MAGRQIYNPAGFKNIEENGKVTGYQFQFKAQYYRGITLSIVRDIQINVDGEDVKREDIRFTVNGETFTLEEMRRREGLLFSSLSGNTSLQKIDIRILAQIP